MLRTPRVKHANKYDTEDREMRRREVASWMISGGIIEGKAMTTEALAIRHGVDEAVIRRDIRQLKKKLARSVEGTPQLKQTLQYLMVSAMGMIQADKTRALEEYYRLKNYTYGPNGEDLMPATRLEADMRYQMIGFLKLSQEANDQILTLVRNLTSNGDVNVFIDNSTTTNNVLTTEAAAKLMFDKFGSNRLLPSFSQDDTIVELGDVNER